MNYESIASKIDTKHKVTHDRNEIPHRVSNVGQLKWYVLSTKENVDKVINKLKLILEKSNKYADIRPYIGRILPMVYQKENEPERKVGGYIWVEAIVNKISYDRIMSWINDNNLKYETYGFTTTTRGIREVGDSYRGKMYAHTFNDIKNVLRLDEKNREGNPEYHKVMKGIIEATNKQKENKKKIWDSMSTEDKETLVQDACTDSIYFNITKGLFSGMSATLPIHDYDDISKVCKNNQIRLYVDTAPGEEYAQLVWFYPDQLSIID